jgi:heat shock protein HslJ
MRKALICVPFMVLLAASCSGQKKNPSQRTPSIVEDSVVFYETDYKTKQKSYFKELQGKWTIVSMRRQQKAELENLAGVTVEFRADTSFAGKAPCNNMGGKYTLKGTSIKFSNVYTTKMACGNLEQETAFLKLLQETVSAYSVTDQQLLLRDGAGNIVFEARKEAM